MKKLALLILGICFSFTLSSCMVMEYATTQDDIYVETEVDVVRSNVSFDVIIQYGTPYYRNGVLLYYLYRDIYYYPYYYNNYWYVRAYRRPFTHFDTRPYFRPHRYDYRFSPGRYRGFDRSGVPRISQRPPRLDPPRRDGNPRFGQPNRQQSTPNRTNTRPNERPNVQQNRRPQSGTIPEPQPRQVTPRQTPTPRQNTAPIQSRPSGNFGGSRSSGNTSNGRFGGRR